MPTEELALEKRYREAMAGITHDGLEKEHQLLESAIIMSGRAVINTSFDFLFKWLKENKAYKSYRRLVLSNERSKAKFEDDVNRSVADSALFGSEADIIYAALSVNEQGLSSYGETTVVLRVSPIEGRVSALETNSFFFLELMTRNGWIFGNPLPAGYMAGWDKKHWLATAKLAKDLKKGITVEEIGKIVLTSIGDRSTDSFIELYIYGKIIPSVIEKIKLPIALKKSNTRRVNELEKKYHIEYY